MTIKELNQLDTARKELRKILKESLSNPAKMEDAYVILDLFGEQIKYARRKIIKTESEKTYECVECDAHCKKVLKFEIHDPKLCEETGLSGEANFIQVGEHAET